MVIAPIHRRKLVLATGAALLALACTGLGAQTAWPAKPVRMVVPFAPGGAGGNLGAEAVAKSAPDGYTLLMGTVGTPPDVVNRIPQEVARGGKYIGRAGGLSPS